MQRYGLIISLFIPLLFYSNKTSFALHNQVSKRIPVDTTIINDTHLFLFCTSDTISGLAISGDISFHSDTSLVRIILMDNNYNEYLIFETYPLLAGSRQFSVDETGEETALLNNITPHRVTFEIVDASVYLKEIITNIEYKYKAESYDDLLRQQTLNKIDRINRNIQNTGQKWVAGETSISRLSYQEKKRMFGGVVPNFQGFEYYVGGVFVLPGAKDDINSMDKKSENLSQPESQYASEFSWKNRHGEDWVTPVKHQGVGCGSCWAFGATAAAELLVNLYFNRHLDYDLSEQNIISCTSGSCTGGLVRWALNYIKNTGVVMEDCFTYTASDQNCSEMCNNPLERISIDNWITEYYSVEDRKREIINGVNAAEISFWSHLMQIVGYRVLEEGDNLFLTDANTNVNNIDSSWVTIEYNDPLIGQTAWLFKNSWGEDWGDNGYVYVIGDKNDILLYSMYGPVSSLEYDEADILCTDNDGDGYYSWGIGPKPSHCPDSPEEADGDDSDPCIGPIDEYGNFTYFTPIPEANDTTSLLGQTIPDLYATGSNIRWYSDKKRLNLVHTGNVFTTGHTEPGEYTYFVTQTVSGCESAADDVSLSIWLEVPRPIGKDTAIYAGEPAILTVEGEQGAVFKWYEDPSLTNHLHTGELYETAKTDTGDYTYYVTQTLYLSESDADTVMLKIHDPPINIPDTVFLYALIGQGVDLNGDSLISYTEANETTELLLRGEQDTGGQQCINRLAIKSLDGIEFFTNLEILNINCTMLENLTLSDHTGLTYLDCSHNQLMTLDISSCTGLKSLYCEANNLAEIDVTTNSVLSALQCGENELLRLVISNNTALLELSCRDNKLHNLDISNNDLIEKLDISGMPALAEVCIRDTLFLHEAITIDTTGSPNVYYTTECFYNEYVFIPDPAFYTALINNKVDANQDGLISYTEAEEITTLHINNVGISDMTGIEAFDNLNHLNCSANPLTTGLDVSNNTALTILFCSSNRLKKLDLSYQSKLRRIHCHNNDLSSLDVSGNSELLVLRCSSNQLSNLDIAGNKELEYLYCVNNWLASLDISNNTALRELECGYNQLTSLDVSKNTLLQFLEINNMPMLNEVCVWTMPFQNLVDVHIHKSPNVYFTDCAEPILYDIDTSLYQPEFIEVKSSENGMVFLVPDSTDNDLDTIFNYLINSIEAIAHTAIYVPIAGLGNGTYWLYATDGAGNLSEPKAFSILGVGIQEATAEQIRIFPNPALDCIAVQVKETEIYSVEITSMNGQIIQRLNARGPTCQIDLSSLGKGVYIITVRSRDQVWTEKIIKL